MHYRLGVVRQLAFLFGLLIWVRWAQADVNLSTGSFEAGVSISVPSFRGLEPFLNLSYSSSSGWSMGGVSSIQRASKGGGAPQWDSSDVYYLDGLELLDCAQYTAASDPTVFNHCAQTGSTHVTKAKTHLKIRKTGNDWVVIASGQTTTYQPVFRTPSGIYRWAISKAEDVNSNEAAYRYVCDTGSGTPSTTNCSGTSTVAMYLDQVSYNGTELRLYWETRNDPVLSGIGGSFELVRFRLKSVDVKTGNRPVRAYKFSYQGVNRSALTAVDEYGSNRRITSDGTVSAPQDQKLRKMEAEYYPGGNQRLSLGWMSHSIGSPSNLLQFFVTDLNGDQRSDLIELLHDYHGSPDVNFNAKVFLADTNGEYATTPVFEGQLGSFTDCLDYCEDNDQSCRTLCIADVLCTPDERFPSIQRCEERIHLPDLSEPEKHTWIPADVDGDGLRDLIHVHARRLNVFRWTGSAFVLFAANRAKIAKPESTFAADVNGDGKIDLVQTEAGAGDTANLYTYIAGSLGYPDVISQPALLPYYENMKWSVADVDGDGKSEIVQVTKSSSPDTTVLRWNGSGFVVSSTVTSAGGGLPNQLLYGDVNGDGKTDIVSLYSEGSAKYEAIYLSNGTSFADAMVQSLPSLNLADSTQFLLSDPDADGRDDLIQIVNQNEHEVITTFKVGSDFKHAYAFQQSFNNIPADSTVGPFGWLVADPNGDGKNDLVGVWINGSGVPLQVYQAQTEPSAGLLKKIKNPELRGEKTITYIRLNDPSRPNEKLPMALDLVSSVTAADGRWNSYTTQYDYEGGKFSLAEKRFLGFSHVTQTNPLGDSLETYFRQTKAGAGQAYLTYIRNHEDKVATRAEYNYCDTTEAGNACEASSDLESSVPVNSWGYDCALQCDDRHGGTACNATLCQTTHVKSSYDDYGNIRETRNYGDIHTADDDLTTIRSYCRNDDLGLSVVSSEELRAGLGDQGELLRKTEYEYDGKKTCSSRLQGVLTKTKVKVGGVRRGEIVTSYDHDRWGNLISVVDPGGHKTLNRFDSTYHLYPTDVTNPVGETAETEWDLDLGLPLSATDPRGIQVSRSTYDAFGRPQTTTDVMGITTTYQYSPYQNSTNTAFASTTTPININNREVFQTTKSYLDGLGRTWKNVRSDGAQQIIEYVRDVANHQSKVIASMWHWAGETPIKETAISDDLGRTVKVIHPDNTFSRMTYEYDASNRMKKTVVYDEENHFKTSWTDTLGRLRWMKDGNTATMTYHYDRLGQLKKVIGPSGFPVETEYDSLGRAIQSCDANLGANQCVTTVYDAEGKVLRKEDSFGRRTLFTYDKAHRLLSRREPPEAKGLKGRITKWIYEKNTGRIKQIIHPKWKETYEYKKIRSSDPIERAVSVETCIEGDCKTLETRVDIYGRTSEITYPDGDSVTYEYNDPQGRLSKVPGYVETGPPSRAIEYDSQWRVTKIRFANDTYSDFDFDSQRLWLNRIRHSDANDEQIFNVRYHRETDGLITSTSSLDPLRRLTFTYDELHRLTDVTGGQDQHWTYDLHGNIQTNSRVGNYGYPTGQNIYAVTNAGGAQYQYDPLGNMTGRKCTNSTDPNSCERTMAYDAYNRLTEIHKGSDVARYTYGPGEGRIKRRAASGTTLYFSPLYEVENGTLIKYIFAAGNRIAKKEGTTKTFYHQDHLGSVALLTDASGQKTAEYHYRPFGESINPPNNANTIGYADLPISNPNDPDKDLIYMHARFYDPELGRFLSADSILPSLTNTQALNRYAYVYNNPIHFTDPSGHRPCMPESHPGQTCVGYDLQGVMMSGWLRARAAWEMRIFQDSLLDSYRRGQEFAARDIGLARMQIQFQNAFRLPPPPTFIFKPGTPGQPVAPTPIKVDTIAQYLAEQTGKSRPDVGVPGVEDDLSGVGIGPCTNCDEGVPGKIYELPEVVISASSITILGIVWPNQTDPLAWIDEFKTRWATGVADIVRDYIFNPKNPTDYALLAVGPIVKTGKNIVKITVREGLKALARTEERIWIEKIARETWEKAVKTGRDDCALYACDAGNEFSKLGTRIRGWSYQNDVIEYHGPGIKGVGHVVLEVQGPHTGVSYFISWGLQAATPQQLFALHPRSYGTWYLNLPSPGIYGGQWRFWK